MVRCAETSPRAVAECRRPRRRWGTSPRFEDPVDDVPVVPSPRRDGVPVPVSGLGPRHIGGNGLVNLPVLSPEIRRTRTSCTS